MRNLGVRLCFLGIALLWSGQAFAQEITGSIRGKVLDVSGAVVSSASITARRAETGLARTVESDVQGDFDFVELPVGHYRLSVEAKGFQKYVQEGITLDVNQTAMVTMRLTVGTSTQQIEVRADAAVIETTVTSLGKTVEEREVLDLPLNGRNFSQLGLLQPGVVPITPGLAEAGGSLRNGQAYAVNGQRPESNNFLIDGADNFNGVDAGFVIQPPIDAIAEFRILTHSANAEFGHSSGSTTNIITRSGTNAFHGAAWDFLRNDAIDAKSFFAQEVEPLKRNQFGGTFGGPIHKDKTFFFAYYEGLRNRQGETVAATVPSAAERTGNFADMCPEGFTGGFCNNPANQLVNEFSGQPFPNNQLPGINPISQTLLQYYPLANSGPNGFITTQTLDQDNDQFGMRLDHYLTTRDVLNFRYMFTQGNTTDPLSTAGANVPGFPVGEAQRAQNFVAQETHTFSPTLVGVARFSFLRNKILFDEHINHTTPASLGFAYAPSLDLAIGPPFVQVSGYASIGDPITGPRDTYESAFDESASVTWIRGRHELKFGGGFGHDDINVLQGIATNGFFVFAPAPISNAFASFLAGAPAFFLQGGGDLSRGLRGNNLNFYGQDTYRVTKHLTLNAGLRYDLPFPYTEIHNRQNLFEPGVQSVIFPNAPPGLVYPGDPGVPAGLIQTEKTAFAPRIGLAWDPTGSGRWLVTTAYGIFYEPYYTGQGGPLQTPISAPPFLQTPQLNFPNFADPFNGVNPFNESFAQPMTLLTLDKNLRLPYAQDWNLNIQRSFGADWLFEIGYVGTKGTKLPRFIEGNPPVFVPGESTEDNVNQRRLYSGCTLADPTEPCNYASVGLIAGIANSSYNAMEVSLRKRFSHGLSFLASYTLSKTIDDVSSFNITGSASQSVAGENDLAQNPFDLSAERGRSMFDARNRLVISYNWNLPFWNHPQNWYQHVLGNWQANGITTFMSGTPFTVYDSQDVSLQGGAPEISGFSSNRPDLVGDPNSGPRTPQEWFNVSAFQRLDPVAQAGQFGNEGRNVVQGPGYQQWDFSLFKDIPLFRESKRLQFRAEFFNVFNHANFRLPDSDISSPNFGQIQEALPGRLVQLALKFLF
jgi:outer membrane receptor protein involved in Fe transport